MYIYIWVNLSFKIVVLKPIYQKSVRSFKIQLLYFETRDYTFTILNHYNYESIDEIFLSNTCKYLPQKTSVFNYYICKPFFLYHINDFLNKFNFKNIKLKSVKDCDKLFKLLIKYFSNIEIRSKIDESKGNLRSLKMVFY